MGFYVVIVSARPDTMKLAPSIRAGNASHAEQGFDRQFDQTPSHAHKWFMYHAVGGVNKSPCSVFKYRVDQPVSAGSLSELTSNHLLVLPEATSFGNIEIAYFTTFPAFNCPSTLGYFNAGAL